MKDKIYLNSPYFVKVMLLNLKAFLNFGKRYSREHGTYLNQYIQNWDSSADDLLNYQKEELIVLLKECYMHVPYYRTSFLENKISISDIENRPFDSLKKLPILTKAERKSEVEQIVNTNPSRKLAEIGYTSGTSGSPTKNYVDNESIAKSFALWSRFHHTIGIEKGHKSIRFSGRLIVNPTQKSAPFWVYNYIEKQLFMSSYHLKEGNLKGYIDKINEFKPDYLDGYPSAFYIISKYALDNNIKIDCKPIAITVTAETLYDYQREVIEKVFSCKVFNQYASSEGSPVISECKSGNLHINIDSGYFEFLNANNEEAGPGEIARLVVTSFRNLKTPLLRYDILDSVLMPKNELNCSCGCQMPIVEKLIGREDDLLWTDEKGYVGRMDTAYKGLEGIVQSQIIQTDKNLFVVNNVVDNQFSDYQKNRFIKNLQDRLGENIIIKMNIVEEIPLGKNGKFEAVKRLCKIEK